MHIILDFDGTVTEQDTIGALASCAIGFHQQDRGLDPSLAWAHILAEYAADHSRHAALYQPKEPDRITLRQEIDFLRSLREVELRSLGRVHDSGLFAGLSPSELERAGRDAVRRGEVRVRKGFGDFVREAARDRRHDISVVSVNWSTSFVRGVLSTAGVELDIVANEVGGSEGGRILGPERRGGEILATCEDKLEAVKVLLGHGDQDQVAATSAVYFGDSATDLECLAEQKGIVIAEGNDGGLLKTLRRLQIDIKHISAMPDGRAALAWARDFDEVLRWDVFGLRGP